jgi:hypothetical protein
LTKQSEDDSPVLKKGPLFKKLPIVEIDEEDEALVACEYQVKSFEEIYFVNPLEDKDSIQKICADIKEHQVEDYSSLLVIAKINRPEKDPDKVEETIEERKARKEEEKRIQAELDDPYGRKKKVKEQWQEDNGE